MFAQGCVIEDGPDSSFTVYNESDYWIYELWIYEAGFEPDFEFLGGEPLRKGDSITVDVDCGDYNVLVVDETGVECELVGVDLCFDDDGWVITNGTLDRCAFGVNASESQAAPIESSESQLVSM